jgi:hypothetical protein
MKDLAQLAVFTALFALPSSAGTQAGGVPPVLSDEHVHPSGAFTFRTPEGWSLATYGPSPPMLEARSGNLIVRFLFRPEEAGYDSLHVDCMLERLAGPMDMEPRVKYEYDFLGGTVGERRILDSAFVVHYDQPRLGQRDWRQRTVTLVGAGESLCVMTYCPATVWKKSKETRALLDAIVRSVTFKPWR